MPTTLGPIVGDIGTVITLDCGTAISGYNLIKFQVKKPNNNTVIWSGVVSSVPSGLVQYTTVSGDFSVAGFYTVYPEITFGNGNKFSGTAQRFEVKNPFD